MAKLPSPADVAQMLFRCRRTWLPAVFPNGRIEGNKFLLGDCYGSPGDSLPIPFDRQERVTDFGSDWSGDDLDLYGRGRGHEDDEKAAWLDAAGFLGLTEAKPHLALVRSPERKRSVNVPHEPSENIDENYEPPGSLIPNGGIATNRLELSPNGDELTDFERSPNGHAKGRHDTSPSWGQEVGSWTFLTAEGEPWVDAVRFETGEVSKSGKPKKAFHHYLWPAQAWVHGKILIPKPMLLFGLPDLLARPKDPVLVVGGEKCAEAAIDMGYLATTNVSGEGSVSYADLKPLAGRTVTVWRDNDSKGEKWQADLLAGLAKLKPSCTVKIVQLPEDAPDGWDIADALADDSGWTGDRVRALVDEAQEPELPDVAYEPLRFIDWAALRNISPPAREYLIPGMLPVGVVTSLYGSGGAGKSLLAQLLCTCAAMGIPFLGQAIPLCVAMLINAEDEDDELHRRQVAINAYLGIRSKADHAGTLLTQGRMGMANDLVAHTKGKTAKPTPLLDEIGDSARDSRTRLVVLDNAAHMFSGDEVNRAEVTQFLARLNRLARMLKAAVLLLGHPPKVPTRPGVQGGDEAAYSGSTAWWNNVRGLWTLDRIEKDSEIRRLRVLKANYGPVGAELRVRWHEGVMKSAEEPMPLSQMDLKFKQHEVRRTVLAALDELAAQRIAASHIPTARNYLPRVIVAKGMSNGFTVETLSRGLDELLKDKTVEWVDVLDFRSGDGHWARGLKRKAAI